MERTESAADRFEAFVQDYGERVFRFAYRLSGNADEAKELAQEALYRALRGWDRLDLRGSADGWFLTVLRRLILDGRRRFASRKVLSLDRPAEAREDAEPWADRIPCREEALLESLERRESEELVRRTLDGLRYAYRSVLALCDMQGLSYEEAARVLQVPVGTVRSRLSRARAAFKARIARYR